MYLSRVEINPYRRETMHALRSPQMMHAAVMQSFDSFGDPSGDRVLWRVDKVGFTTYILVQSNKKPDFHHIVNQYGRPDTGQTWESVEYDDFLRTISCGQTWMFRLRANPTHSVAGLGSGPRGKVVAHVTYEQQIEWLMKRADSLGVEFVSIDVSNRDTMVFKRQGKNITIGVATFEGLLKVTDSKKLVDSMTSGIGRAKAYGCGLLTIMRVGSDKCRETESA